MPAGFGLPLPFPGCPLSPCSSAAVSITHYISILLREATSAKFWTLRAIALFPVSPSLSNNLGLQLIGLLFGTVLAIHWGVPLKLTVSNDASICPNSSFHSSSKSSTSYDSPTFSASCAPERDSNDFQGKPFPWLCNLLRLWARPQFQLSILPSL